jgi:hypothetical protein
MDAIPYNPQDTEYFVGDLDMLRDPEATYFREPPADHVFNPAWPVQNFQYPQGTGFIRRLQFTVDENGDPQLATYIITAAQATRLNMITNPTREQATAGTMPLPLLPLKPNQAIVKTKEASGLFAGAERWMIVDTTKTPKAPITSPEGGSYTDADRARDNAVASAVSRIAKALGL